MTGVGASLTGDILDGPFLVDNGAGAGAGLSLVCVSAAVTGRGDCSSFLAERDALVTTGTVAGLTAATVVSCAVSDGALTELEVLAFLVGDRGLAVVDLVVFGAIVLAVVE